MTDIRRPPILRSALLFAALLLTPCLLSGGAPVWGQEERDEGRPYVPEPSYPDDEGGGGMPGWLIAVLVVLGLGLVGAVIAVVAAQQAGKKKKKLEIDSQNVLDGYRLQKHLVTGQTSQVWEVVEVVSSRHFAMKMLLPEKANNPEHRRQLFHEASVGLKLQHPNIIKIIKVVKDPKYPYILMEFFPSGSLKLKLMRFKENYEYLRDKTHHILKQTATALAFMNAKGWVHRDIKPDNILVNSNGDARLIDFAIAELIPKGMAKTFRRKKKPQGTRSYMSPEQIRGEVLDGRSDIYSFGVSAYEVVTGRPPFRASSNQELLNKHIHEKPTSPQAFNADVTDEFAALVLRMLSKKREQRPKDFHEVLMQLRGIKVFKSQKALVSGAE
jgi:serine/threonine-protein kinase